MVLPADAAPRPCHRRDRRVAALSLLAALVALGCRVEASSSPAEPRGSTPVVEAPGAAPRGGDNAAPGGYPGELLSTEELDGEFVARQQLSGRSGEQAFRFEAAIQLRGGTLTVLGLTPMGTKAFVLEQQGTEVRFEALIERELPFPPEYILQDIHRTWLWHARLPWGAGPPAEEAPSAELAGERVREQWSGGKLVRRSFERLDGEPPGTLRIDYIGGHRQGLPPPRVVIDNAWFGYRLEIETLEWRKL